MTQLEVKVLKKSYRVSYNMNHPQAEKIEKWLEYLSPGYVEYLLEFGHDPHCAACRDSQCENICHGGDDACKAFKFGEEW